MNTMHLDFARLFLILVPMVVVLGILGILVIVLLVTAWRRQLRREKDLEQAHAQMQQSAAQSDDAWSESARRLQMNLPDDTPREIDEQQPPGWNSPDAAGLDRPTPEGPPGYDDESAQDDADDEQDDEDPNRPWRLDINWREGGDDDDDPPTDREDDADDEAGGPDESDDDSPRRPGP